MLKRISEGKQKEKDPIKGAEAAEVTIKFHLEDETFKSRGFVDNQFSPLCFVHSVSILCYLVLMNT